MYVFLKTLCRNNFLEHVSSFIFSNRLENAWPFPEVALGV